LDHWANWQNFISAEDYTNMSYYNGCGIRPKHSNISKRVREGVFTIIMSLILLSGTLHDWLVMELENLLRWEHTLQINNQLIKHNIATILISIPHKLHVSALLKKNNYSIFIPVVAI
jgi:hypothetical protein